MARLIIGFTGTKASGKGEVIKILHNQGFISLSLSDIVRREASRRGLQMSTENLQNVGNEMREKEGAEVLAKRITTIIENTLSNFPLIAIDSIRNPGEVELFRQHFGDKFVLMAVDADRETRMKRYLQREGATEEEFERADARDRGIREKDSGQQVPTCIEMADRKIINNGTLKELKEKTISIFKDLQTSKEGAGSRMEKE